MRAWVQEMNGREAMRMRIAALEKRVEQLEAKLTEKKSAPKRTLWQSLTDSDTSYV